MAIGMSMVRELAGAKLLSKYGVAPTSDTMRILKDNGIFKDSKTFRQFEDDLQSKANAGIHARSGVGDPSHESSFGREFEEKFYGHNGIGGNIYNATREDDAAINSALKAFQTSSKLSGVKSLPQSNVKIYAGAHKNAGKEVTFDRYNPKYQRQLAESPEYQAEQELKRAQSEYRHAQYVNGRVSKDSYGGEGLSQEQMEASEKLSDAEERVKKAQGKIDELLEAESQKIYEQSMEKAYQEELSAGAISESGAYSTGTKKTAGGRHSGKAQGTEEKATSTAEETVTQSSKGPNTFQQETMKVASGGTFDPAKYAPANKDMSWFEANAHTHLNESVQEDFNNFVARAQGAKNAEEFNKVMEAAGLKGATQKDYIEKAQAHFGDKIKKGPGAYNYFAGNHGWGATGLTVAGASVISMASSRGRKSNSELYSDPFR